MQEELERRSESESKQLSDDTRKTLKQIQVFLGNSGEVINKAKLFEAGILKEGSQMGPKIVSVLVSYHEKMERTLFEMRELLASSDQFSEPAKLKAKVKKKTPSKL